MSRSSVATWDPVPWSPFRALFWEHGRLAGRTLLIVAVAECLLAALVYQSLSALGPARDGLVFAQLLQAFLIVNIVALISCREGGLKLGFEQRLLLLPMPTWALVLGRLGPPLVAAAGMQWLVTLVVKTLYGAAWPMIAPSLLAMACMAWALALSWSLGRWPYWAVAGMLVVALVAHAWLRPRLGPSRLWEQASSADAMTLLLAIATAATLAVVAVSRQRAEPRGEGRLRTARPKARSGAGKRTFRGPVQAQLWLEWREKGWLLVLWGLAGHVVNVTLGIVPQLDTAGLLKATFIFTVFTLLVPPAVAGFVHGRSGFASETAELDMMRATRPLADPLLAWTLLWAGARSVLGNWAVVLSGSVLVVAGLQRWGDADAVDRVLSGLQRYTGSWSAADWLVAAALLLAAGWSLMALVASLTLTGRHWPVVTLIFLPTLLLAVLAICEGFFDLGIWHRLLIPGAWFLALLPTTATLWAAYVAMQRKLVSPRTLWLAGGAWLALSSLLLSFPALREMLLNQHGVADLGLETALIWCGPGLLTLTVLPLFLAPLCLSWNRHR